MQPFIQLTATPPDTPLNDTTPNQPAQPTQEEFIHNFSNIEWHEDEPTPATMLHLLTITGLLIVGIYTTDSQWGEHFIAWAPLSDAPLQLH